MCPSCVPAQCLGPPVQGLRQICLSHQHGQVALGLSERGNWTTMIPQAVFLGWNVGISVGYRVYHFLFFRRMMTFVSSFMTQGFAKLLWGPKKWHAKNPTRSDRFGHSFRWLENLATKMRSACLPWPIGSMGLVYIQLHSPCTIKNQPNESKYTSPVDQKQVVESFQTKINRQIQENTRGDHSLKRRPGLLILT